MLNKVIIMGRLVRDPELRRTQSGVAVTSIRIAVDRDFKGQDGTKQADFFDVVAWRGTAEFVSKYFAKGRMAVVEGRLQTRDWTDREGGKRVATEIVADNVYFGDSKRDGAGEYGGAPAYSAPMGGGHSAAAPMDGHSDFAEIGEVDGDLPF
nr:single-stranded DNA-binding protein [uncultured Oscillibacter sp.]